MKDHREEEAWTEDGLMADTKERQNVEIMQLQK